MEFLVNRPKNSRLVGTYLYELWVVYVTAILFGFIGYDQGPIRISMIPHMMHGHAVVRLDLHWMVRQPGIDALAFFRRCAESVGQAKMISRGQHRVVFAAHAIVCLVDHEIQDVFACQVPREYRVIHGHLAQHVIELGSGRINLGLAAVGHVPGLPLVHRSLACRQECHPLVLHATHYLDLRGLAVLRGDVEYGLAIERKLTTIAPGDGLEGTGGYLDHDQRLIASKICCCRPATSSLGT